MKELLAAVLISLAFTLACLYLHIMPSSNSMINLRTSTLSDEKPLISNEYLTIAITYHKEHPAFAKRPLTTYLVEKLSSISSLDLGTSFTVINFSFLFLCGLAVYWCSTLLGHNAAEALWSMTLFYTSFSVLFSFFPPIYSYDEPLQYLLIYLSLIALLYGNWLLFVCFFSLGLIARESGLILLPGFALLVVSYEKPLSFCLKRILLLGLPVLIYATFLYVFISETNIEEASRQDFMDRFSHFFGNFRNLKFTLESFTSFLLATGLQAYLLYCYASRKLLTNTEKRYAAAFVLVLVINTLVVFLTTQARETRLFALPLIFLFPFLGKYFISEYRLIRTKISQATKMELARNFALVAVLAGLSLVVTNSYYFQTIGSPSDNLFNEYTGLAAILFFSHFVFRFVLKPKSEAVA
ncbi:hypothetical protein H9Q13_12880 [Pontibacter sp. JH31]|uniref:Uncharacterized protein n=1 Tax=Pontibacter aquaedesilientis TaxID=2766980 RepID=A0ABR7XID7_9BACT|nr:hypothetical protein [Pontibacter aquaedesilientis]MBD1398065.1 hypothetical protein [Pontibacter aquaedesilientis]